MKNIVIALVLFGLTTSAWADSASRSEAFATNQNNEARYWSSSVHGTWLIDVTFPPEAGAPPFKEVITFHRGGTLTESNTTLHANSANPFFNFNGSPGHGTWKYRWVRGRGGRTVSFRLVKLVFDGETNAHIGYLRVTSRVRIEDGLLIQDAEDSLTELIIGPDIETGIVQPFGGADATGIRIAEAP